MHSGLTLNICFTLCRGRFTLSLCSSCRTSPMLRLPSPFLSASSNVCFSHFGAKLGANTNPQASHVHPTLQPREQRLRDPSPRVPSYCPFLQSVTQQGAGDLHPVDSEVSPQPLCSRILVPGTLAAGQAVLITDTSHEVTQASDPGTCLITTG